jgi:protein-S-isoprenylcysteine O-methyltransferase Ste14
VENNNIQKTKNHSFNLYKRAAFLIIQLLFGLGICLISAGDIMYLGAWILTGLFLVIYVIFFFILPKDVKENRANKDANKALYEKVLVIPMYLFGYGTYVIAGLDQRLGWSTDIPLYMLILAIFIFAIGMLITGWSMRENPYFSKMQTAEDHPIITSGPYQIIRHPGYLGMMTYLSVVPIILESLYAMLPTLLVILLFIIRTYMEDHYLRTHSPAYQKYADEVKHKLFRSYKS